MESIALDFIRKPSTRHVKIYTAEHGYIEAVYINSDTCIEMTIGIDHKPADINLLEHYLERKIITVTEIRFRKRRYLFY